MREQGIWSAEAMLRRRKQSLRTPRSENVHDLDPINRLSNLHYFRSAEALLAHSKVINSP
jgi:hypothetical protein